MKDKVVVTFSDGRKKEIQLPRYGEIKLELRNGKVANIKTVKSEKIC